MLSSNQKMVCVFNQNTSKHLLETENLEPVSLVSAPHLFPPNYFKSVDGLMNGHHIKDELKTEFPLKAVNPETKFYDFSLIFSQLGGHFYKGCYDDEDNKILKEIFIPEINEYLSFEDAGCVGNLIPTSVAKGTIIILRLTEIELKVETEEENSEEMQSSSQAENNHKDHENNIEFGLSQLKVNNTNNSGFDQDIENLAMAHKSEETKDRDRTRTIGEVINYVRKWRNLADNGFNGIKMNLQEAAVHTGVPKKSLDDYYYQLRMAEKFEFDFEGSLDKNISVLRKYVKGKVPNRKHNEKEDKEEKANSKKSQILVELSKVPKKLKDYPATSPLAVPLTLTLASNAPLPAIAPENRFIIPHPLSKSTVSQNEVENDTESVGSNKIYNLSNSDVSSINRWPMNLSKDEVIFDDEDSFFNEFKYGNEFE